MPCGQATALWFFMAVPLQFIWKGEFSVLLKRLKKSEKGQAMVEFALCLPLVLVILGAVMDFGWVFMHELTLSTAVREGARIASVSAGSGSYIDETMEKVEDTASICNNGSLNVSVTATNPGHPGDGDIEVRATYDLQMLTPMAKLIFGGMTYEIHSSCVMRAE